MLSPPGADARRPAPLDAFFGALELEVLELIWTRSDEATVRDVQEAFPDTAYTTLMTTLDRLFKKGVLDRRKRGRAYAYRASFTRSELRSHLARDAFEALLGATDNRASLRPLMSSFVEAVSARDAALLEELEQLVQEKRDAQRDPSGDHGAHGETPTDAGGGGE